MILPAVGEMYCIVLIYYLIYCIVKANYAKWFSADLNCSYDTPYISGLFLSKVRCLEKGACYSLKRTVSYEEALY